MENEVKTADPELQLIKEKAAFTAIFFVTLILCGFFRVGSYSPLIAIYTTVASMAVYIYKYRKAKKVEAA